MRGPLHLLVAAVVLSAVSSPSDGFTLLPSLAFTVRASRGPLLPQNDRQKSVSPPLPLVPFSPLPPLHGRRKKVVEGAALDAPAASLPQPPSLSPSPAPAVTAQLSTTGAAASRAKAEADPSADVSAEHPGFDVATFAPGQTLPPEATFNPFEIEEPFSFPPKPFENNRIWKSSSNMPTTDANSTLANLWKKVSSPTPTAIELDYPSFLEDVELAAGLSAPAFFSETDKTDLARTLARRETGQPWMPPAPEMRSMQEEWRRVPTENADFATFLPLDDDHVEALGPFLKVFGTVVVPKHEDSGYVPPNTNGIKKGIYKFKFHGPIRHKDGMEHWARLLIDRDCGLPCGSVLFDAGGRKADPIDGIDEWDLLYLPS